MPKLKVKKRRSTSTDKPYRDIGPKIADGIKNISLNRERRAKRARFYHNGNRFFQGVVIPVSMERYGSLDNLMMDLTSIFTNKVTLPYGVRTIYSKTGRKVSRIDDIEDGEEYVCSAGEHFKRINYGNPDALQPLRLSVISRKSK